MAFRNMTAEIRGLPKMNLPLAQTMVNRGLQKIYDENVWSFQIGEGGWITPLPIATQNIPGGLITAATFSDQIVGDANAAAAWAAIPAGYSITDFQIRFPAYALYSIIDYAVDVPSAGLATLTLDRPWMEPNGALRPYQMYQAYYPAPTQRPGARFKRWLAVRDFTNAANLDWWSYKQESLDAIDPQRTVFQNPAAVVPYKVDTRTGSSTLGSMLYELYPGPMSNLPYALYFVEDPGELQNPADEIPYPLTEEVVLYRAKEQAYIWCEENKGRYPELMKTDWGFLMQASAEMYKDRIKDIRKRDRDMVDSFVTTIRRKYPTVGGPFYSAITGGATVGNFG